MTNHRLTNLKTVLWALVGVLAAVSVARFARGLGAVTHLSDAMPWGYWNAFKIGAVALSAGGFVLAGAIYIFGLQKYHDFARPAVLTAFLGYLTFVFILLFDLGLPWNIWHPMIYPQDRSVLFEVAICVMLYLTVLGLEFAPVILEHPWFDRPLLRSIHKALKKAMIPLVIAGIVLSTLHQSSLGSLFLIAPYRLHPLWYSPIIWVLFFTSAVGLGLLVIVAETLLVSWLFGRELRMDLLSGLGRAAAAVLCLYAALRLGDLALRGQLHLAFDGSWQASLFWFEMALSALLPATLLLWRRVRASVAGLGLCAAMTIFGVVGYRFDVCIVAFAHRMPYFPSWMEVAVSVGIVAAAMLAFLFFVEKLRVFPPEAHPAAPAPRAAADLYNPAALGLLLVDSFRAPRRYTLALLVGAALAVPLMPPAALWGRQEPSTPAPAPRTMDGWMLPRGPRLGHALGVAWPGGAMPAGAAPMKLMVLRGSAGRGVVLFPHAYHIDKLGQNACATCHHQNLPFDTNTSCVACHRDMYRATDIFNHALHVDESGANASCVKCHRDDTQPKTRGTAVACATCHAGMPVAGAFVKPRPGGVRGFAPSYMDAMHGLCAACHQKEIDDRRVPEEPAFAQCANCHRGVDADQFRQAPPYVAAESPQ